MPSSLYWGLQKSLLGLPVTRQGGEHRVGQDRIGLIFSPNLCYPSMHEWEGIQDLHPLIREGVQLHGDGNADRSDKLFCLVPASVKGLWLCCLRTSRGMACCWLVRQDCLCYGRCRFGCCI